MIPFLPDLLSAPGALAAGDAMPQAPVLTGTGLNFAELLGAALPESVAASEAAVPAPAPPSNPPLALPTGKNVPEPGVPLPPPPPPVSLPTAPPTLRAGAVRPLSPGPDPDEALPVPVADEVAPDIITVPPALVDAAVDADADAALPEPSAPDPALVATMLLPVPATPPAAPPQREARPAEAERAVTAPAARPGKGGSPAPSTVTLVPVADAAQPVPDLPATPSRAPAAPLPAPEGPAPSALPPAQALAAPPAMLTTPAPEPVDAPRVPAPQLESSIAQVGDLREALRSARPEMTLRHGEFGFVALRLEQSGAQDWRAVLASRDPGFVPAIQAALADRAVAAASASAETGQFLGQPGAGQNGTSDPRYGASPSGGQGGSQPSFGHSANRHGEAAPDHRHPSTAAALAARAEEGEEASGSPAAPTHGMFA
ncbi:hypothetical protein ACLBKT_12420 [Erythrobacter sp. W302b]|uniref:hypothetical protein n=1 Tax=Erythrobacter sp. W302b TaxID=3389874 RepID=UPI00396B2FA7